MASEKAVLVYQNGLANVFRVECFNMNPFGREAKRMLQGAFSECEWFAKGLVAAGWQVVSMSCDKTGDITNAQWAPTGDAVFRNRANPIYSMGYCAYLVMVTNEKEGE